jgi:hypothetical protein
VREAAERGLMMPLLAAGGMGWITGGDGTHGTVEWIVEPLWQGPCPAGTRQGDRGCYPVTRDESIKNQDLEIVLLVSATLKVAGKLANPIFRFIAPLVPVIGNKLDFVFGRASGTPDNIQRSQAMLGQLQSVGLYDTPATRDLIQKELVRVFSQPGVAQEGGRIVRDSLIMGPNGGLKMESIWEGEKLITIILYGGK